MNKMCSVPNCENKGYNSNVKFYTFPLSEHKLIQRRRWIAALNKYCVFEAYWTPNKYNTICSEHFIGGKKSDAMNSPSYVPTIFPPPTPKGKRKLDRVLKQRTVGCVAPKCSNNISKGYRLFRFPRDSARRAIWIQNCRLDNWKPTSTSRLCEAHFESSEWEANRIDGGMNLKPNAIPTIFNVPKTPKKKATKQSVFKMETVFIKQDPDSIQEPTTECSTAWFPIVDDDDDDDDDDEEEEEKEVKEEEDDDDDEQHQQLLSQGFQQIFFEEESPVVQEDERCSEEVLDCSTVKSEPEICSASELVNSAAEVVAPNSESVQTCPKPVRKRIRTKVFNCPQCSYKTFRPNYLRIHMRKHTGEKPFSCELCHFKCVSSDNLRIHHIRLHAEQKSFSCEVCGFSSSEANAFKRHLQTHSGEKPFSCDFCDYKSNRQSNLKVHLRTHTGEKPYSCEFCDQKFTVAVTLRNHLKKHKKEIHN